MLPMEWPFEVHLSASAIGSASMHRLSLSLTHTHTLPPFEPEHFIQLHPFNLCCSPILGILFHCSGQLRPCAHACCVFVQPVAKPWESSSQTRGSLPFVCPSRARWGVSASHNMPLHMTCPTCRLSAAVNGGGGLWLGSKQLALPPLSGASH